MPFYKKSKIANRSNSSKRSKIRFSGLLDEDIKPPETKKKRVEKPPAIPTQFQHPPTNPPTTSTATAPTVSKEKDKEKEKKPIISPKSKLQYSFKYFKVKLFSENI